MKNLYLGFILTIIPFASICQTVYTFDYTGAEQTFVVPAGVTSIEVDVRGAEGGDAIGTAVGWGGGPCNVDGGDGGRVVATIPVTPGETLYLYVGGEGSMITGGFNGGGSPAPCSGTEVISAGGGGGSDIRQGGNTINDRIIVAGGGGGASGSGNTSYSTNNNSGAGGGLTGANSVVPSSGPCLIGLGGTQVAGGNGGNNSCWCVLTDVGGNGSLGQGGNSSCVASGLSTCSCSGTGCVSGGGGGGGYYGGGAGLSFGGGGGGSSYTFGSATAITHTQGYQTGNGQIIITVFCTGLTTNVSATTLCEFEELTLEATSSLGGTITWDNGVTNGVPFVPANEGVITYTATSDNGGDCGFSVDINVLPSPEFSLTTNDEIFGNDGDVSMTIIDAIPPFLYDWDNDGTGDFDDSQNLNNVPGGTYTVVMSHGNGCSTTETAVVNSVLNMSELVNPIKLFPNPTTDVITIFTSGQFSYNLYDITGKVIISGAGNSAQMLDLKNIAQGQYLIEIFDEHNNVFKTIIIKK